MNRSLRQRLSLALLFSIAGVAVVAGALSFVTAYNEARELQDDVLRRVSQLVAQVQARSPGAPLDLHVQGEEDDSRVIVQALDAGPAAPHDGASAEPRLALPATLPDGLRTIEIDGEPYRVLVRTTAAGRRFAVLQDSRLRRELARDGALRTVLPIVLLVPVLLLVVARLVRQLFEPIAHLADEANQRHERDLRPMPDAQVPVEVRPFVLAINRLLARVDAMVRAQQRFVADAAHELRSPLTALSLQAERLAQVELPEAGRERLAVLRRGIARGSQLIDQLLALARAQVPAQVASPTGATSVQAVFRRVLEDLMPLAEAGAIDIGVAGTQDARLQVAEPELYTLVRNLVDNAIRYTPPGGQVDLALQVAGGSVVLSVCDSGPGIASDERARVFEPFYRAPGSEQPGSGLGLAIVQAIASRMGGEVELHDADPKRQAGLRVTVTLPAALCADPATSSS